ncbi:hypothetical protein KVR01_009840 [Diaporthe batatas]|uniref:uncharacterized protein n=1 Tax=Diaporthe batatas TaxID=748121 RepID=UPI001D0505C8|nr:uncharacterized protein KVR01_009840 [Diaporthe batatas]KAG8160304.1 hypothetical protein KVR01_009840 [Diaporthe batatas]
MGWLWGKSAPEKPATSQSEGQAPAAQQPPQASTSSPETDPEITKFLEELAGGLRNARNATDNSNPPSNQPATQQPPAAAPKTTSSSWSSWWPGSSTSPTPSEPDASSTSQAPTSTDEALSAPSTTAPADEPRLSPLAESILPTTMDCEQAFNQAFYCQSLGGQWNNIYRYGGVRSCSENWDDFWFCMRVKGYQAGPVKDNMIREHYRKKHLAKYGPGKPSSEDVWRERRERVPPGSAFSEQVEAPTVSDAEYQKWEMERMDRIRKATTS